MGGRRQADLLIDPRMRWVVEDRGVTWATDRFVILRADLFARPPQPTANGAAQPLPVTKVRDMLATVRVEGEALHLHQAVHFIAPSGERSLVYRCGSVTVFLNARVARSLRALDLTPRYVHPGRVAWWGERRGKRVLCGIQMAVTPFSLKADDFRAAS